MLVDAQMELDILDELLKNVRDEMKKIREKGFSADDRLKEELTKEYWQLSKVRDDLKLLINIRRKRIAIEKAPALIAFGEGLAKMK